jgi:agmatinase
MNEPDLSFGPHFLDLEGDAARYERSRVAVLPVPYGGTVSYGRGTERGPAAILAASTQVELFDEETGGEAWREGIATLAPVRVPGGNGADAVDAVVDATRRRAEEVLADGKLPLILGGEHSISEGPVAACDAKYSGLTVLQLDAHSDLREEYEGRRRNHACAGARMREHARVVQLGIRSQCPEERAVIDAGEIVTIFAWEMAAPGWEERLLEQLPEGGPLYLTVDLDYFDPSIMPATGTPEPGGGLWWPTLRVLRRALGKTRMVGLDIMELSPIEGLHAPDFLAARLAYKLLGYGLGEPSPETASEG